MQYLRCKRQLLDWHTGHDKEDRKLWVLDKRRTLKIRRFSKHDYNEHWQFEGSKLQHEQVQYSDDWKVKGQPW